jgi:3-hydroxyacyl-CoA dehydrogenase
VILATNTSTYPIAQLAAKLVRPGRLVGLHFFNPAPLMPLVEVIAGAANKLVTDELTKRLNDFAKEKPRTEAQIKEEAAKLAAQGVIPNNQREIVEQAVKMVIDASLEESSEDKKR